MFALVQAEVALADSAVVVLLVRVVVLLGDVNVVVVVVPSIREGEGWWGVWKGLSHVVTSLLCAGATHAFHENLGLHE